MSIFLIVAGIALAAGTLVYGFVTIPDRVALVVTLTVLGLLMAMVGSGMYEGQQRASCESSGGEYHREFSHYIVGYKGAMTPVYDTECVK